MESEYVAYVHKDSALVEIWSFSQGRWDLELHVKLSKL